MLEKSECLRAILPQQGGNFVEVNCCLYPKMKRYLTSLVLLMEAMGKITFALPDLRGRLPVHQGNGFILAETKWCGGSNPNS